MWWRGVETWAKSGGDAHHTRGARQRQLEPDGASSLLEVIYMCYILPAKAHQLWSALRPREGAQGGGSRWLKVGNGKARPSQLALSAFYGTSSRLGMNYDAMHPLCPGVAAAKPSVTRGSHLGEIHKMANRGGLQISRQVASRQSIFSDMA